MDFDAQKVWERHDILNCLCVAEHSLFLFPTADKTKLLKALSDVHAMLFCLRRARRQNAKRALGYFREEVLKSRANLEELFNAETDENKKFILGFLLKAVKETLSRSEEVPL